MLERLPYFKLHSADYLLDTLDLTHAEHGIYCLMIEEGTTPREAAISAMRSPLA